MADIRINALTTTATSSASDDFIAIDGSANGTRKLSVYSPTFGGNLTVSGTSTFGSDATAGTNWFRTNNNSGFLSNLYYSSGWKYSGNGGGLAIYSDSSNGGVIATAAVNSSGAAAAATLTTAFTLAGANATLAGNLTVSGTGIFPRPSNTARQIIVGWDDAGSGNPAICYPQATGYSLDFRDTSVTGTVLGRFSGSGNLLLGTTTDNGAKTTISRSGAAPASSGSTSNATLRVVDTSNNIALDFGVDPASPYAPWIQACDRSNLATNYPLSLQRNGGNVLIGTNTDSGNGKLQLAAGAADKTSGIGFGTDTSFYRYTAGRLAISHIGGSTPALYLLEGTTETARLWTASGPCYLDTLTAQSIILRPNGTTALTLDSSQNASFAGTIKPQQAATASAPSYVKGAIYFDTTLNKLRVGGATGWETITSV